MKNPFFIIAVLVFVMLVAITVSSISIMYFSDLLGYILIGVAVALLIATVIVIIVTFSKLKK